MKKVIPKKKNAFLNKDNPMPFIKIDSFNSISPSVSGSSSCSVSGSSSYIVGMAKENIKWGDLVVFNENMKKLGFQVQKNKMHV